MFVTAPPVEINCADAAESFASLIKSPSHDGPNASAGVAVQITNAVSVSDKTRGEAFDERRAASAKERGVSM
jgi:hypothetical protein